MRRRAILAPLVPLALLAGCTAPPTGEPGPKAGDVSPQASDPGSKAGHLSPQASDLRSETGDVSPRAGDPGPKVGGAFGARPTIVFPAGKPAAELRIGEPTTGKGARLGAGDVAIVQYTAHVWDGRENRLTDSSFTRGVPAAFTVGTLPPGLDRALAGRTVGSRVTAAVPARSGDLFYVVDILGAHAKGASVKGGGGSLAGVRVTGGTRPGLSIPVGAPPARFAAKVLSRGTGRPALAGQLLVTQYEAATWATKRVFDTTWQTGVPKAFRVGDGTRIKGWDKALTGVPVGSRVLMIVPPAYGYGPAGDPASGIGGSDTLVYVVDVLAAY